MPTLDEIYGKNKKPVQPQLFETDDPRLFCDGRGNDAKRARLHAAGKPTFMVVSSTEYKCLLCRQLVSNPVYFKERYCLTCDTFHDKTDEA